MLLNNITRILPGSINVCDVWLIACLVVEGFDEVVLGDWGEDCGAVEGVGGTGRFGDWGEDVVVVIVVEVVDVELEGVEDGHGLGSPSELMMLDQPTTIKMPSMINSK